LALLSTGAGLGAQAAGGAAAGAATEQGAETQAAIEKLNQAYRKKIFDEQMARLMPYQQAGVNQGLPLLSQYLSGNVDLSSMPLYNMQKTAGETGLKQQGMANPFVMNYFNEGLNAAENQAGRGRFSDLLQLSLGASQNAGQGAQNYANALSNSFVNTGNSLSSGTMNANNIRQSAYGDIAGTVGGIPAAYQNYKTNQGIRNYLQANGYLGG